MRGVRELEDRTSSGLIVPKGHVCEDCAKKDEEIAELRAELDRIIVQVGSELHTRAERRAFRNKSRTGAKGRRPARGPTPRVTGRPRYLREVKDEDAG